MYSRIQKKVSLSVSPHRPAITGPPAVSEHDMYLYIPAHLPWVAKDVEHSQSTFCVEIPTSDDSYGAGDVLETLSESEENVIVENLPGVPEGDEVRDDLFDEMITAKKRGRPLRIYFRCSKGSPEKALWIRAFSRIGRFSNEVRQKKSLLIALASPLYMGPSRVRTRNKDGADFARATRQLDRDDSEAATSTATSGVCLTEHIEGMARLKDQKRRSKEYKVLPHYAYPHRWMTYQEMREEMLLPSAHFHDLRVPDTKEKEIGSLRVEVLECIGLPKLDRMSETDGVVYLVCGKYAFSTDVIANHANPMWLRYAKRACVFPIFHAYARLFVGVFDDDGENSKDDFAGRVVVNLARLRPASTYDVTLPLRLSTHAFARKKRGAIRLRFTLNWNNEREALLSYIPSKINIPLPQHSKPNLDVTIPCGDPKAFRNIALTVHGSHMQGRFTFPKVKAVIREMNFTRKTMINLIRQEIFDIREWRTPSVSAYVFMAWMHCIYSNSFSLVPAYTVFYFVLLLMRTYAIYGMDGPSQRGFLPPSWEELLGTLVRGGKSNQDGAIQPLNMVMRSRPPREPGRFSYLPLEESVDYKVSTHVPWFKWLLGGLGFLPEGEDEVELDEYHLEFPFADGKIYPKFRVRECLAGRKDDKDNEVSWHGSSENVTDSLRMTRDHNGEIRLIPRFDMDFEIMRKDSSGLRDYDEEEKNFATRQAIRHTRKAATHNLRKTANDVCEATGINHMASGISQVVSPLKTGVEHMGHAMLEYNSGHRRRKSLGSDTDTVSSTFAGEHVHMDYFGEVVPSAQTRKVENKDGTEHSVPSNATVADSTSKGSECQPWPDQDLDQSGPSTNKKLTDDLNESKDKMHELTWHLFDDKVYTIKDSKACYFGDAKKSAKRRKNDIPKQLNKLLQVDQYSNNNPFVARLGLYVEPIVESALSFLSMFRALFNAVTWQDPMLTFWLSIFLSVLALVLFIFPWRIFLFFVGGFLVGPQNYVIRRLRESGHLPPRKVFTRVHSKKEVEQGPITYGHVGLHGILGPKPRPEVDPKEVQHVVVPYSPLMYQRFYDWPPEPQYAQVKAESPANKISKPAHIRSKSQSLGSVVSETHQAAWRNFRRRFHRRSISMDEAPTRFTRTRHHSSDWQTLPWQGTLSPKKER
uniref:C2 domain-containing protein n=1 Tax=Amphora coffeiformis TaxID=265554 RepID=A0A7S3PCB1_9STRA